MKAKEYALVDIGEIREGDIVLDMGGDGYPRREGKCVGTGCIAEYVGIELEPLRGIFKGRRRWRVVMWDGKMIRKRVV